jgi:L-threonylcarbamoyladenylate synthase
VELLRAENGTVDRAVAALRAGKPVILPTDTVYGLCASPYSSQPVERAYALKGRDVAQPTALIVSDVDMLFECIPELRGRVGPLLRELLPGPLTLVVANPACRYRWLAGSTPDAIGIRVPELPERAAAVLGRVGAVMATSANLPGGLDPRRVEDIPQRILDECDVVIDAGELPGTPSTVIDLTGDEARVLREGAVPAEDVLARVRAGFATGAASGRG